MTSTETTDRKKRRKSKSLGDKTINKLLSSPSTNRDRCIISLLINTGLRRVDISKIKIEELNFEDDTLTVPNQQKTGDLAYLTLPSKLMSDLRIYIKENLKAKNTWLFPSPRKGKHLSRRQINNIVDNICEEAEITDVTPHDFRATFLTNAGKRGIPPKMIMEALGVSYVTVMNYYQHFTLEDKKEAFSKIQRG